MHADILNNIFEGNSLIGNDRATLTFGRNKYFIHVKLFLLFL